MQHVRICDVLSMARDNSAAKSARFRSIVNFRIEVLCNAMCLVSGLLMCPIFTRQMICHELGNYRFP